MVRENFKMAAKNYDGVDGVGLIFPNRNLTETPSSDIVGILLCKSAEN
jgi:hypothetical protein